MAFKNFDIVIFKDVIKLNGSTEELTNKVKKEVLDSLLNYLEKEEHLRVMIHPKQ